MPVAGVANYPRHMAEIKKVGICGSGIMGSGLAEVAAKAGYDVIVRSRSQASADAMIASIDKGLEKQVQREKISADDKAAIMGRLSATDKIADLKDCDLVIESVVEDLDVKKLLFAELDKAVKPGAILATNTSTLPVVEMAVATGRPDRRQGCRAAGQKRRPARRHRCRGGFPGCPRIRAPGWLRAPSCDRPRAAGRGRIPRAAPRRAQGCSRGCRSADSPAR